MKCSRCLNFRLFLTAAFAMLPIICGCDEKPAVPAASGKPNVLLVTFDTTRADFFSCYGRPGNVTPNIDRIANEGIRFARCYAPAPITLPSHASIMTGLYPFQHQLRDNGAGVLDDKAVTLAELFQSAGYRTGAFVGAYVLHSRYGLKQGFDVYSDDFKGIGARMEDGAEFAERRAQAVSDAALEWLEQKDDRPFFLWVHYFDPHSPYEPPGAAAGADIRDLYAAEISYADGEMSRVVRRVEQRSQNANRQSWYIIAGDHGEGLGDHGEETHAFFVYNTTLHVPLVIKGEGIPKGLVSDASVSLVDLYPSIAQWLKLPLPYEVAGAVLPLNAQAGHGSRALYFETVAPFHLYGWSPLVGVISGRDKFIHAPADELYDLSNDPGETKNLADDKKERAAELAQLLKDSKSGSPGIPILSAGKPEDHPASVQKLLSLGYVSGSLELPSETSSLPDPKAMIGVVGKLKETEKLFSGGDLNGVTSLSEIFAVDPNNVRALKALENFLIHPRFRKSLIPVGRNRMQQALVPPFDLEIPAALGLALCMEGQTDEGFETVSRAERIDPSSHEVLAARSVCLERTGKFDDAVSLWEKAVQGNPQNAAAFDALGDLYVRKQDFGTAADFFNKSLAIDPENAETQANLGNAYMQSNKMAEAATAFRRALDLAPHLTQLRTKLGSLLLTLGQYAPAVDQYRLVVAALPEIPEAHYDLGVALTQNSQHAEAEAEFRETLRLSPNHADALINLGVALLRQGRSPEGVETLTKATQIEAVAGAAHFNLAIAARRAGNTELQMRHLEQAAASRPPSPTAIEELRRIQANKSSREGGSVQPP